MPESLYVCHFSNGHIKVGRSIDATARIAQHEERVACMGVLLVEHFVVECLAPCSPREAALIARCAAAATERFKSEWFSGLDFPTACEWAKEAAQLALAQPQRQQEPGSFGERLRAARIAAGLRQEDLGVGLGTDGTDVGKQVIYGWEKDQHFPRVDQLRLLCDRLGVSPTRLLYGERRAADWPSVIRSILEQGRNQVEIAGACGCNQSSISDLLRGATKEPSHSLGEKLLALARQTAALAA